LSPISLAFLFTAASPNGPTLFLWVDVGPESPCRVAGLAAAVRVLRPDAALVAGKRPRPSDLEADISDTSGALTLTVRGEGKPLIRSLPPAGPSCEATVQTAALMIDRYLDELNERAEEVRIEELGHPSRPDLALGVSLGASVVQAPVALSPGLDLELDFRLGLALLSLGGEVNLAQSDSAATVSATYHLQPAALWLALGVAPRLGPGRFVAQASLGLTLVWATIESSAAPFQKQQGHAVDPFVGLRVGYVLDLPARFSLALRYEERWVPRPTAFSVEGFAGSVSVRRFAGDLTLMAGYSLF
jgi:hypothetical protein